MDIQTIITIGLPVVAIIIFIALIIVFKDRLSALEFDPRKLKIRAEFVQGVKELERKAQTIRTTVGSGRRLSDSGPVIDFTAQSPRDLVLEALGALKENIYSACTVKQIQLSPSAGVLEAVSRLQEGGNVNADIAFLVKVLHNLGQKIAGARMVIPPKSQASSYIKSVDFVVSWIKDNILTQIAKPPPPPPPPRQTVVGEHYALPRRGQPATWLIGVEGAVQGKRYPVDRMPYRIGSRAGNELCIKDDDYVSGEHAYLRYESGRLFLIDQGSRNGTFLNSQQITHTPHLVQRGDRIRIGESVLEVSESNSAATPSKGNGDEIQKGVRDPTYVP